MKKRIISLVLLGISVLTVTVCAVLQAQSQRMVEKIIRLHVVANSDSNVDQAVKLCVRDAVLREAQRALSSAADAKQAILTDLPALKQRQTQSYSGRGAGIPPASASAASCSRRATMIRFLCRRVCTSRCA